MKNITDILVPTDFSDYSDLALAKAVNLAQFTSARIHLIYVMDEAPEIFKQSRYIAKGKDTIREELTRQCKSAFKAQLEKCVETDRVEIITKALRGIPVKEILDYEKEIQADMVVIATQGSTALEDFIFGSTTSKIIRHAVGSVLVVRKPKYD